MSRPRLLDLFETYVVRSEDRCWSWTGRTHSEGYAVIYLAGTQTYGHRLSYEFHFGPIPEGLEIDHLCRTKSCCNPDHLEAVTHAENIRRIQDRQMACRRAGHDWTNPRNVYVRKNGRRWCAECARQHERQKRAS